MFMQVGFAMVETGYARAKNAVHIMAMNMVIYPVGVLGFWLTGFGFMMGGVSGWPTLGGAAAAPARTRSALHDRRPPLRPLRRVALRAGQRRAGSQQPGDVPVRRGLHGHGGDHPDRRAGRALAVRGVPLLRAVHVDVPVSALRQLGLGRRLAVGAGAEGAPRAWSRRLRRLVGGAHDRRDRRGWRARSSLGPRAGKFRRDGTIVAMPGHNLPMSVLGRWCWPSAGSGSTPARRCRRPTRASPSSPSTPCSPRRPARCRR